MALDELIEALLDAEKSVLILDTCTLLDVLQSPFRDTMHIAQAAVRIRADIQSGTLPFSLVLPSLFSQEWTDNVLHVQEELQQHLDKHRNQSNILSSLHQLLNGSPLSIPDVTTYLFAEELQKVCTDIITAADVIHAQDQCALKAGQRVIEARAPAQKGKQSYKDCQIFEETLLVGQNLEAKVLRVRSCLRVPTKQIMGKQKTSCL